MARKKRIPTMGVPHKKKKKKKKKKFLSNIFTSCVRGFVVANLTKTAYNRFHDC